jgi:hypothetical protein
MQPAAGTVKCTKLAQFECYYLHIIWGGSNLDSYLFNTYSEILELSDSVTFLTCCSALSYTVADNRINVR